MALSTKNYEAIAELIHDMKDDHDSSDLVFQDIIDSVAIKLAESFKRDNPNFNAYRFFVAAGVNTYKITAELE